MAALNDETKLFIVRALACYDAPRQVAEDVKQEFNLVVSAQQLQAYNPATKAGARMSAKLKVIFEETRKQFKEKIGDIPLANQSVRIRALSRLFEKAERQGNTAVAAQLLEQIAKEAGDAFTNKQRVSVNALVTSREPRELTDEELAEELAKYGIKP